MTFHFGENRHFLVGVDTWGFTTDSFQVPGQDELERLLEAVDYTQIFLEHDTLTVPDGMQLDLGAVGKGYVADETAQVLQENGVTSALLDFGGNILTIGGKPNGSPWRVGIRDPDSEGNLGVLELTGQGVSVSGGYEKYFVGEDGERYWHILDPATGAPARSGLVQTTVVSEESRRCDALSTALFVMGLEDAVQFWREHRDFEMILLAEDQTIYMTEGLSHSFSLFYLAASGKAAIVIFVGYPIWWDEAPAMIATFLAENNFNGKVIAPFCTSSYSPIDNSLHIFQELASGGMVMNGLTANDQSGIRPWVDQVMSGALEP